MKDPAGAFDEFRSTFASPIWHDVKMQQHPAACSQSNCRESYDAQVKSLDEQVCVWCCRCTWLILVRRWTCSRRERVSKSSDVSVVWRKWTKVGSRFLQVLLYNSVEWRRFTFKETHTVWNTPSYLNKTYQVDSLSLRRIAWVESQTTNVNLNTK